MGGSRDYRGGSDEQPGGHGNADDRDEGCAANGDVHKIRRLPIANEQGKLLGTVTQRDLFEKSKAETPRLA